jgi:hypothetical protein
MSVGYSHDTYLFHVYYTCRYTATEGTVTADIKGDILDGVYILDDAH